MLDEPIEPPAVLTPVNSRIDIFLALNRPEGVGDGVEFNRLIDWLEAPGQSSGSPEVAAVLVPAKNVRVAVRCLVRYTPSIV